MKFPCISKVNSNFRNKFDKVIKKSSVVSPDTDMKSKNRDAQISMVTILVNIICFTFLLWTLHYSYSVRDINKYAIGKRNIYKSKIGLILKRNIAEGHQQNENPQIQVDLLEDDIYPLSSFDEVMESVHEELDESEIPETLEELIEKGEELYNNVIEEMKYQYEDFCENKNTVWCQKKWDKHWNLYLNYLRDDIKDCLNDENIPIQEKYKIILYLNKWCLHDFEKFKDMLQMAWDMKDEPEFYLER
ncbi:hypothetical protein MKS88_004717 [Plasmodium brasilianum]|uniref:Plasmodium RESA N-terminal domain-containing protein n=2 Tax=Plasmodium (Plasmodium) TaxID=418103 RepID=A0A1D3SQN3_PLAMA|nr:Plasmodium exported protein, unknown function [Plasmodium malariae]KAI4836910.1 hypothetical protein MKS88_004717 [Plasmodium brasilianum]SCO94212.1 Plasmodium exported protein, unknown function [Plasmodium malariae]